MHVYGELTGILTASQTLTGKVSATGKIDGLLTIPNAILPPTYEGEYSVTPTAEAQVLDTDHLYLMDNITINPIPNNYGLITYDGSIITVS